MRKPLLWMLIAPASHPALPMLLPTLAWMAEDAGACFECYLENRREGNLFARTGSTVLSGQHHQQFNYLNATFEVEYLLLGETAVFRSSIGAFGARVLAAGATASALYACLGAQPVGVAVVYGPVGGAEVGPYLFPEIYFRRALGLPVTEAAAPGLCVFVDGPGEVLDQWQEGDTIGSVTLRIAERWKHRARGVAFGDPEVVLPQIPWYCREGRIAVYGPVVPLHPPQVRVSAYTEQTSSIAPEVARLCEEIGNRVLVGRQTGDGDLMAWSKAGVCMAITDPNRPAFPVAATVSHPWAASPGRALYDGEPDDATLRRYAAEGKILATLVWHSGEPAHNEAMLNLCELANFTGLKMGIGAHASRYETCPQLWELTATPREAGGVAGLIEPLLHSGGLGIMAEVHCPPEILAAHCREALERIRRVAGDAWTPRGYYGFLDADLDTLAPGPPGLYEAVGECGLDYMISSARPGRNRVLAEGGGCVVLNQTPRSIASASPFLRVTTLEELLEDAPRHRPGWLIAALDSPVIAFTPYIWEHGQRFMRIVHWLTESASIVNVLPGTVARYARILKEEGWLPQ